MSDKISQRENVVKGDLAGRDLIKHVYHAETRATTISTLLERYKKEQECDEPFDGWIVEIEHYRKPIEDPPIGLEAKLEKAGRTKDYRLAAIYKEQFAKKLVKHQLSQTAQYIFAYVLARIEHLFLTYVEPLLDAGAERNVVTKALAERVIDPVIDELEGNVLIITHAELRGMVFYLTGNCYLRWHAE